MIYNVPITTLIVCGIITLVGVLCVFTIDFASFLPLKRQNTKIVNIILTIPIILIVFGFVFWWYNGTESGKRSAKTWQSNIDSGITRQVRVYDMEGDLLQEYTGKFDIEFNDNERILFDDENGNRHVIYFKTGTVIVDEVDDE